MACFSFHPRKVITTGDGGMVTTNRADWDELFHLLRLHGMTMSTAQRHGAKTVAFESYDLFGYNYRMTDIQAAIGREQLKRLPEIVRLRRALAERYFEILRDIPGWGCPRSLPGPAATGRASASGCRMAATSGEVMQRMLDAGVSTRRGVMCSHRERVYAQEPWSCGMGPARAAARPGTCERLAESEKAQDRCIVLPLFAQMTRGAAGSGRGGAQGRRFPP